MNDQILDRLEEDSSLDRSQQLRDHRLNAVDYTINMLLVLFAGMFGLTGLAGSETVLIGLLLMLPLGAYQLLSATIGAVRGNRAKLTYLLTALGGLALVSLVGFFLETRGHGLDEAFFVFGMLAAYLGACYYTHLCYQAKLRTEL